METDKLNTFTEKRGKLMKIASYASVVTALLLILIKIGAFIFTGSMAILATVVDSCLDLLASFINMIAVRQATVPADRQHRFGHGKFESLAGLGQATFVFGSGLFLMVTSLAKIGKDYEIENIGVGVIVMLLSIAATAGLLVVQNYVVKRTDSVAIAADKAHYTGDLMINFSVIVSLMLDKAFGFYFADILFAVGISFYLMHTAYGVFKKSLAMLTDMEISADDRQKIAEILLNTNGVDGIHDLRTRFAGDKIFIQVHLEVDGNKQLYETHTIADNAEDAVMNAFPNAEVLIHQDPTKLKENHPDLWYDLGVKVKKSGNKGKTKTGTKTKTKTKLTKKPIRK